MTERPRTESEPRPPSFEPPEEIEEILGMSVDEELYDKAIGRRDEFEGQLPTLEAQRKLLEDLRSLMKISAYIEVLRVDPSKAPEDVKQFGVDSFRALLEQEETKLKTKYPDIKMGPIDKTVPRSENQTALDYLKEIYPEYYDVRSRIDAFQERISQAGIEIGKSYKFVGSYPKGAKGMLFTVTGIDQLSGGLVSGTLFGQANSEDVWSVSIEDLEKSDETPNE
jgi:hypothetical protein